MKQKKYYWQPELSTSIIYWSCTFAILFISLILSLEYTRPYLTSNLVLVVFFIFVYLGLNRYFKISSQAIEIHYFIPFRKKTIAFSSIEQITVGAKSIEISSSELKKHAGIYIMTKKKKEAFIRALEENDQFKGKINKDDQLKTGHH